MNGIAEMRKEVSKIRRTVVTAVILTKDMKLPAYILLLISSLCIHIMYTFPWTETELMQMRSNSSMLISVVDDRGLITMEPFLKCMGMARSPNRYAPPFQIL